MNIVHCKIFLKKEIFIKIIIIIKIKSTKISQNF